jgi:hypothetical protein
MRAHDLVSRAFVLVFLLFQLLLPSRAFAAEDTGARMAEGAVSILRKSDAHLQATVEQFVRLLPATFGFGERVLYSLPRDSILASLTSLGVVADGIRLDFDQPLTKGRVAAVLVKGLLLEKGTVLERLLIWAFLSREACFRVAVRERLIPPGKAEDPLTITELAAVLIAVTVRTESNLLPDADGESIALFARAIADNVIAVDEAKDILRIADPAVIKAMRAL